MPGAMGKASQYFALIITASLVMTVFAKGMRHGLPNDSSENEQKGVSRVRVKRQWFLIPIAVGIIICLIWCDQHPPPEDNDKPYFSFCPSDISITIPKGKISVKVTWLEPVAKDRTSPIASMKETRGRSSGRYFTKSEQIRYRAYDSYSNYADCRFNVFITLRTCRKPTDPDNGNVRCPISPLLSFLLSLGTPLSGVIWGGSCTWSCNTGYEVADKSFATQECLQTGQFANNKPQCIEKRCGEVTAYFGAHMSFEKCDNGDKYQSRCYIQCVDGYGPRNRTRVLKCDSDQKWTGELSPCEELPDKNPPFFEFCPDDIQITIPEGQTSVRVTWRDPIAQDKDSGIDRIVQTGPKNGSRFDKLTRITFVATDKQTNSAECSFLVDVKLITCVRPSTPSNGDVSCPSRATGFVNWGDVCTWSCEPGYDVSGTKRQTCTENGQFSEGGIVSCNKIQCSDIDEAIRTHMVLNSCTDENYFASTCILECENGYGPLKPIRKVTCNPQKMWEGDIPECRDIDPPYFISCPQPITVYTSKGKDTGFANWTQPDAKDDQGNPVIRLILGLPSGSDFPSKPENLHRIVFSATDQASNEAEQCVFTVQVIDRTCYPLSYSDKLNVSCDGYTWGSKCHLSCQDGYPLNGSSPVYCEEKDDKSLDWEVGQYKPHCTVLPCPDLTPPENGALACSKWSHGRVCQMSCNKHYTTPLTELYGSGEWVCDDTQGNWFPNKKPRGCTREITPNATQTQNSILYFTGNCNDPSTQATIREHFITKLKTSGYKTICKADCNVDNVDVTCGPITRRRKSIRNKRSILTHKVKIDFTFRMNIRYPENFTSDSAEDVLNSIDEALSEMSDLFKQFLSTGVMDLDIPGLDIEVDPDSHTHGWFEFECEYGMKPNYASFSCAMCPKGTIYNGESDDCMDCPIGTYQDESGKLQCTQCPQYTTTLTTGSTHVNQCNRICDVGHFSPTGFLPCAFCPIGTYQDEMGARYCKKCPGGTTTLSTVAIDIGLCLDIDKIDNYMLCNGTACNGGICLFNTDGTTHCVCYDDYTGEACEIPPDPCDDIECENGGNCIPFYGNSTCECPLGYTGQHCQDHAQNGEFTNWSLWSNCSVTCETGTRSRYRECTNPEPGPNGLPCQGETQESLLCHLAECPACEALEFPDSYIYECETTEDVEHVCDIRCKDGYASVLNRFRRIRCGPTTDYEWSFRIGNPNRNLPSCAKSLLPKTLSVASTLSNPSIPCSSSVSLDNVQAFVGEHSNCSMMPNCKTNVYTECRGTGGKRRIRSLSSSLTTVIEIVGTLPNIDYFPNGIYDSDIATQAAGSWMTLAYDMTNLVESLSNSSTSEELVVIADGVEYSVTHEYIPGQQCEQGKVPEQGLCVTCPVGMYQNNESCNLCDVGYYQDREGQASCVQCPENYTTLAEGSIRKSQCYDPDMDNTTSATTNDNLDLTSNSDNIVDSMTTSAPDKASGKMKQTPGYLYPTIGAIAGVLFIVIIVASVTIACQKKRRTKHNGSSRKCEAPIVLNEYEDIANTVVNGCTPGTETFPENKRKSISAADNAFPEEQRYIDFPPSSEKDPAGNTLDE